MIFYCDLQGNLKAFQNETVYQGSNNVTTIYVVAPFNRPVGLNISFTKPNKLVTSPAIMKWVGTLGNVKIPVSFVNIPEQFTDTYNVWAYALPYSITEQSGVVGVSVNAVIADSVDESGQQAYRGNLTTFTGQFTVAYSALPSPPTDIPTEWTQDKVLDLLNNYYNDAIQKIGEMNTLKTDAKDTLVKAINEVFDEIASTNATIGDLSNLTTDEKTTIVGAINEVDAHADANKAEIGTLNALTTDEKATLVGAINEVDNHADNATTLANNAVATANNAVATANEAKTTAQTAENNANSAVDTANAANATADEAKAIAQGSQRAIGFATLQAAITALNGYNNTQLKVGDNVYIVETGVPDLWVAAVETNSVAYNYTTNDAFNDDLVENTLVQVGYYKFAYLESDGKPCTVAWQNMTVAASDWVASTEFEDFAYEAKIILSDFVNFSSIPQVVFGLTEATSGNYAPICKAGDKGVYIYSKVNTAITLPTVVTFAPNVHGASMQGGGYANKGKWVASTTYAIDDLVYTDNGQYVCIEGITSTTSPEQDTTHWQATFVATGKTKNTLTISGQDNGTEVQKTFDGSTAVEIAFDENTMTAKEVDGVLKVGAKGTIPEALPQEASALKSGNLPTSGWNAEYSADVFKGTYTNNGSYPDNFYEIPNATAPSGTSKLYITFDNNVTKKENGTYYSSIPGWQYYGIVGPNGKGCSFRLKDDGTVLGALNGNTIIRLASYPISDGTIYNYAISDTSITANSDILMELTDDGGVKSYSMEAGSITVIRDTVPTQAIPYTYKVKQTNASGQFTLVNHFVPSVPESPTSLPVTYKKVSGELPTSGWTSVDAPIWTGSQGNTVAETVLFNLGVTWESLSAMPKTGWTFSYHANNSTTISTKTDDIRYFGDGIGTFIASDFVVKIKPNGDVSFYATNHNANEYILTKITQTTLSKQTYTISDTSITANTSVKMYLTDEGGVKAYSKAVGSIQVIRDTVPTTAIPYEYEVEQTSAEGLFEVINAYVPTKTSQLTNDSGFAKTTEANTWTGVQTFSNADGIKTDRVHNLDNNDAWYNFDGSNNRFGSPSRPTIIRTSEARPRAQVPSGETTVTKEIALLEDVQGSEWAVNNDNSVFPKNGWYLISSMVVGSYQLAPFIALVTSQNNKLVVVTQDLEGHDVTLAMTIGSDRKFADAIRVHTYTIANNTITATSTALSITTLLTDGQFSFDYKLLY